MFSQTKSISSFSRNPCAKGVDRSVRWPGSVIGVTFLLAIASGTPSAHAQNPSTQQKPGSNQVPPAPALSPRDEMSTFKIAPGFRVELVAAEPLVHDPVAIA